MSPTRPVFNDGAILGAGDLTALAGIDRDRDGRASRHLHTPGVGAGLNLTTDERTTESGARFVEVMVQPGYAIDGTGRELVLAEALPVSSDGFGGDIPNAVTQPSSTVTVWYPVFVHGLDSPAASLNGSIGCQTASGPVRVDEDVAVEFGRPGDADAEQPVPPPDAGPGDGGWRVLVGFVQFDTAIGRFVDVASSADGVGVSTAGVRAGLVAGQAGRVEIRPGPMPVAGVPALVVDTDKGGSLQFGLHNGTGGMAPLMTVDASGNLEIPGTVKATQAAGTVRVISGTAFDGTILPLPPGVDQAAIDSGGLELSIFVTPRYPATGTGSDRFLPAECRVDGDRRVHCWGTRFTLSSATVADAPGSADFLMLVSVAGGA